MIEKDEKYMKKAIIEAMKAGDIDEVPIGAVIVHNDKIIARGYNLREKFQDATLHAEVVAIKKACKKLKSWRLCDCTLYVTIEPCPMCAGAIVNSRIPRIVYGAKDLKAGAVDTLYSLLNDDRLNHKCEVISGVLQQDCSEIISVYFKNKREQKKKNK